MHLRFQRKRRSDPPQSSLQSGDPNADLDLESDLGSASTVDPWWTDCKKIVDSKIYTGVALTVLTIDVIFFFFWLVLLLARKSSLSLRFSYTVFDWITAVLFTSEVILRVVAYGISKYVKSTLRMLDLVISAANLTAVVAMQIPNFLSWVQAIRFVRLLRVITILAMMRERTCTWRTEVEVEELKHLLEEERSNRNKLTKWRINSNDIAVGDSAGEGGFGAVRLGLFRGTLVAVKQLFGPDTLAQKTSIEEEAVTLVNLRHPNVVLFMGFVHEPKRLWIVTEYCSRGSLRDLLDDEHMQLSHSRILKFALGAARGLAYLHGQEPGVLHLDLKTSNVLISSGWDAKLADFGLSRSADKPQERAFTGTTQYCAPEILAANVFGPAADVYALGICLWEMAAREVPFHGRQEGDILLGVTQAALRPDVARIARRRRRPEPLAAPTLDIDSITVTDASALTVLRSIASSQGEPPSVVKREAKSSDSGAGDLLSPVTPQRDVEPPWAGAGAGLAARDHSSSAGSVSPAGSLSDWGDRAARPAPGSGRGRRVLSGRPALAAAATQAVAQDHSGNSYSAGDVAEATELVDEQAALSAELRFPLARDSAESVGEIAQRTSARAGSALRHVIAGATLDERVMYLRAHRELEEKQRRRSSEKALSQRGVSSGKYSGGEKQGAVAMCQSYCELVQACWAHDPADRPGADEVVWRLVGMIDSELRSD